MVHFNWLQLVPSVGHEYIHVATMLLASSLLVLMSVLGRVALGSGEYAFTPAKKFGFKALFEGIIEFIVAICDMVVGHDGRKYVPFFSSVFLLVFVNNLLGLLPGLTPATDNLNTTIALGMFIFVIYNKEGFGEHGIGYFKQFFGPVWWLAPFFVIIEIISHFVRPLSLGLRLQGNMMGDHTVLGIFLSLVPYLVPVIFYGLGLFVCFMQAFVFTMLSMIYVSMAISHDH